MIKWLSEDGLEVGRYVYNIIALIVSFIITYLNLNVELILVLTTLIFIDYITGIYRAYTLCENVTSHRMKYGILSKLVLILIPITLSLMAKGVGLDFHIIVNLGLSLLIISEGYSVIGNIYTSRTGENLPELDIIKILAGKILEYIYRVLGGHIKKDDKDVK